jgi:hypothetical protein
MSVQTLCDRLVANEAALTELCIKIDVVDDAELKLILDSAKKNKTLKKVRLEGSILFPKSLVSVPVALSLASVISEHPEIQEIGFNVVKFIEFGPIALAIQQNRNLTRLWFGFCQVTPNHVECIRWLLTQNALESVVLIGNECDGKSSFDISGALLGNSSLKEVVLNDYSDVFGSETFQAIPHMIRTNQDVETIDIYLSDTMTDRYELGRLIAQAAEGHALLNKLAIYYSKCSNDEPSAEVLINHGRTAEAIGMMLHNAPALRVLSLGRLLHGISRSSSFG